MISFLLAFLLVFAVLNGSATWLESLRGEWGLVVGGLTVGALAVAEFAIYGRKPLAALKALGLGMPTGASIAWAATLGAFLLAIIPAYAWWASAELSFRPAWLWLLPGLFAQAGIAEEALFRGYLFGHLREGRSFWRAALLSMIPFVAVHLLMFATLPWPVALASLLLAVSISFPLARLYEIGGRTIWAPAILHFVIQGALKVAEIPGDTTLPIVWIAASGLLPWLAFLARNEGTKS
jgi:membrane protease YdiL (CAAX protease family)